MPKSSVSTANRIGFGTKMISLVHRGGGTGQTTEDTARGLSPDHTDGAAQAATTAASIQSVPESLSASTMRPNGTAESSSHASRLPSKDDQLLAHLSKCAKAVASLSTRIEEVTKLWQSQKQYERDSITPSFQIAQQCLKRLRDFEAELETPNKKQHTAGGIQRPVKSSASTTSREDSAASVPTWRRSDPTLSNEIADSTPGIRRLRSRSQSRYGDDSGGGDFHTQPRHREARTQELGSQRDRSESLRHRPQAPYPPYPRRLRCATSRLPPVTRSKKRTARQQCYA